MSGFSYVSQSRVQDERIARERQTDARLAEAAWQAPKTFRANPYNKCLRNTDIDWPFDNAYVLQRTINS